MDDQWFARKLSELRQAKGLSRKELAAAAGMKSEAGIRNLEQGIRQPTWGTVQMLAAALGVDCTAFANPPVKATQPPADAPKKGPGRPPKVKAEGAESAETPESSGKGSTKDSGKKPRRKKGEG